MEINVPVLLIGFNRPDTIKQVFEKIRDAKPTKLYVAIDGPRVGKEGENDLVKQVQEIVKKVDWQCEAHYSFSDKNKGAEITVSYAISWVFEKEEYAIILEDDIIAPFSFFRFAQEMLIKFKKDQRTGIISGSNFTPIDLSNDNDYFFSKYPHTWGWATWKRVWENFDLNIKIADDHIRTSFLEKITNSNAEKRYYKKLYSQMQKKGAGNITWDYMFQYFLRVNNLISIIPRVNLTSNIGVYGLHARGKTEHHFRSYDENFSIKNHPEKVVCNTEYDKYHFRIYINRQKPFYKRAIRKIIRLMQKDQGNN